MTASFDPGEGATAFDAAADSYDGRFTDTALGRALRRRVWTILDGAFPPGSRVLELGCGTGEDALHLASRGVDVTAIDASSAMLAVAAQKIRGAGLEGRVSFARLVLGAAVPALPEPPGGGCFDGAFSSFGVLNCIADRRPLTAALAERSRPGAALVLVLMGPFCLAESTLLLARGRLRDALRRLRSGRSASVGGAQLPVWYPSARSLLRELEPAFERLRVRGLGVLLPPSDRAALLAGRPRALAFFDRMDQRLCGLSFSSLVADHYVVEMRRFG